MAQNHDSQGILLQSGTNEVEFIEFLIDDVSYGINVAKVQRVLARTAVKITKVDNSDSSCVIGVIYIQEKPITLIDLRKALDIPLSDKVDRDRQLVLVTRFNKTTTAFLIDAINKIHRTSWREFEPIDETLSQQSAASYVTGTIKIEKRVVLILDLEQLMFEFLPEFQVSSPQENGEIARAPELKAARENVRILYAEDSGIIRKLMLNTLRTGGYTQVKSFEHGQAAYDFIDSLRTQAASEGKSIRDFVDCIITDIEMPQMDGLTLCKSIKDNPKDSEIPAVVVYSSLVNDEMARKCKSVGADAQVSKPHGDEILRVIDSLCLKSAAR